MGKIDTCMALCNAKATVEKLSVQFDTHEFITIYEKLFPTEYKSLTSGYTWDGYPHQLIGKFLSKYRYDLGIESAGRSISINVYGRKNECELWRKANL